MAREVILCTLPLRSERKSNRFPKVEIVGKTYISTVIQKRKNSFLHAWRALLIPCVIFFGFTRPAVPSKSGNVDIGLMTVPKLPKNVSTNVPNLEAEGVTRRFFEVQKMSQTLWQEGVREGFFKFNKCPKPRGRRVCAKVFFSSTNVPNLVEGCVREVFLMFKKCPKPRRRG